MDATARMEHQAQQAHPAARPSPTSDVTRPDWWLDWSEETAALVASGPSAAKANIEALRGRAKVVVINESWQLAPWADVLYACDTKWWKLRLGVPKFNGLKVCHVDLKSRQDVDIIRAFPKVRWVHVDRWGDQLLTERPGYLGAGGNSGFQALNLAVQFGAKKILLIGYDMTIAHGEHWHARHPMPLSNPHPQQNLPRWRKSLDGSAGRLRALGVEVVNASPVSELKAFPKMSVEEALARWGEV